MSFVHGKNTVITVNGSDISAYTNNTDMNDETMTHDVTCYGQARKAYQAGLGDGTFGLKGIHDNGVGGPRAILKPLKAAGTAVTFVYRPDGTGSGKQQSSVSVIVKSYKESDSAADMIQWEAEFQMTGALNEANQ